jgi:hypothetical protein
MLNARYAYEKDMASGGMPSRDLGKEQNGGCKVVLQTKHRTSQRETERERERGKERPIMETCVQQYSSLICAPAELGQEVEGSFLARHT